MNVKILSIDTIGLSVRSTNALHRANVHTVGDMLNYSTESLSQIRNLGKKSIEEIVLKIEEYKNWTAPETFEKWILEDVNKQFVIDWLKEKDVKIEALELLSVRAFNLLMFAGYHDLYQIVFLSEEELMKIPRMDDASAAEIKKVVTRYIRENKEDIWKSIEDRGKAGSDPLQTSVYEKLTNSENHDAVLHYVKANDLTIECMGLSNRPKNRLISNGYHYLSDVIFRTPSELQNIPAMGANSVKEILGKINEYFEKNEARIRAVIEGDESALWDDDAIKKRVLDQYTEIGFHGLKLDEIVAGCQLPEYVTIDRLKGIIGQLLADKELEYVDYRCYRIYGKFEDYLDLCTDIEKRSREFIKRRLQGETLEAIARENGLTRERVRQIVKKDIEKVKKYYAATTGMTLFDEDYFRYLYENYAFEKIDGTQWLGVPAYVWNYLDLNDVKHGKKDLETALEDHSGLDAGMRLKIKNYLNRNKLYLDGRWIEKNRADLEQFVVRKFCINDVSFDEFCHIYNTFLEREEIPYDDSVYYTDASYKGRKKYLQTARFLLWKQKELIRYYDIDGRDYSELLDTLNLDSYENIEISTVKFMRDYPEIMKKYDIRDQYELHNLLRKIIPEGSYHNFYCGRMPEIKFGDFDRNAAIFDILADNAPITAADLAQLVSEEYGYDPVIVMANYLQPFGEYYHQGIYSINQKQMSQENKLALKNILIEDFYYIDEIRNIYKKSFPDADMSEINPYNLKTIGFSVYSRYAVQNHASLEAFFEYLLTKEEIMDISAYKKRFVYVQMFYKKLKELKCGLRIIEFEPNQIISFKRLEESGVTKDMIQEFCNAVYDFIEDGEYFSAQSLRLAGYESELYDLGFSDWFYGNLLISDDRFSFGMMFGNLILYKGKADITIKSFETNLIRKHRCIDTYDLMSELTEQFGCNVTERTDILYKIMDTEVYYDKTLDRLYANKEFYYDEIEEGEF